MKIAIQTWGSNGDIRPMLALASGLQRKGHCVTVAISSIDNRDYSELCKSIKVHYQKVPEYIAFDMFDFARRSFKMNALQWLNALLETVFYPYEQTIYQASQQLAAENDLLIGHHFLYPLKVAAKKKHKPHISVTFCHLAIPCQSTPPFHFPKLGKRLNRLQWQLMHWGLDLLLKKRMSQLWKSENMPAIKHIFSDLLSSDLLNLVAVDPVFCAHTEEWNSLNQVCGFLNLPDNTEHWPVPASLENFFQQGEPPVYLTFGSLQQAVPDWAMQLFIDAVQLAGYRAIIQISGSKHQPNSIQGDLYFIGRHPHQPVFKRCAAVVHHGGAGTTQSAALSGCPSIVVPFMDEQLFWACHLQQMGIAGKPLPAKKANAQALAQRIKAVLATPKMKINAEQLSIKMQRNGVEQAIRQITSILSDGLENS